METIFALATPPGKSGVAVIRISGDAVGSVFAALGVSLPAPRVATLVTLMQDGSVLDTALALYFPSPYSFTGEDVAELQVHGSRAVIGQVFKALTALPGLRLAEPGEFARRAFLNGKMDLTMAEGLADLIDADTEAQHKQALRQMQGRNAAFFEGLRSGILEALALLEAYIDFPDEDIPAAVLIEIDIKIQYIIDSIKAQILGSAATEKIRDGVRVAILGPPNAGKSSLMNLLAGRDVAIVSHHAGTTRDVIEVQLDIGGYWVILADTAGIREGEGAIEQEGVRRSLARAREADIRLVVLDASRIAEEAPALEDLLTGDHRPRATLLLVNKSDLVPPAPLPSISGLLPFAISVKNQTGIDALMRELESRIVGICVPEASFVTQLRHRRHLAAALEPMDRFRAFGDAGLELKCEELRRAATEIGKINGKIEVDELLGHIFSRFCIGK